MNIRKPFFALLFTALLLIELPAAVVATDVDAAPLTLDTVQTVEITNSGEQALLSFTPTTAGVYLFLSEAEYDTRGFLYGDQMELLAEDDDSGTGYNFCLTYARQERPIITRSVSMTLTGPAPSP